MQAGTNAQPCARCEEEAIVGLDSEWLCAGCFDAALAVKREQIEEIILRLQAFEEEYGVGSDYEPPSFELRLLPHNPTAFGTMEILPIVDEIESPLLCGGDEE